MVTTLIINTISIFLSVVSILLPSWQLPDYIINAFEDAINLLMFFNGYLPIAASIKGFIIIISFEVSILLARLIFGVISMIRGGGKIEI